MVVVVVVGLGGGGGCFVDVSREFGWTRLCGNLLLGLAVGGLLGRQLGLLLRHRLAVVNGGRGLLVRHFPLDGLGRGICGDK